MKTKLNAEIYSYPRLQPGISLFSMKTLPYKFDSRTEKCNAEGKKLKLAQ